MRSIADLRAASAVAFLQRNGLGTRPLLAQKIFSDSSFTAAGGGRGSGRGRGDVRRNRTDLEEEQVQEEGFGHGSLQRKIFGNLDGSYGRGRGIATPLSPPPPRAIVTPPTPAHSPITPEISKTEVWSQASSEIEDPSPDEAPPASPSAERWANFGNEPDKSFVIPPPVSVAPRQPFVLPKLSKPLGGLGRGRGQPLPELTVPSDGLPMPSGAYPPVEAAQVLRPLIEIPIDEIMKPLTEHLVEAEAVKPTLADFLIGPEPVLKPSLTLPPIGADPVPKPSAERKGKKVVAKVPREQLSNEDARARAIAILEAGIEKSIQEESERRRRTAISKFADAAEFVASKYQREGGGPVPQAEKIRQERASKKERPRQRSAREGTATPAPMVPQELTPEKEAELLRLDEENTFKERLHTLFLVQFEPEYLMEDFGTNPDIHDTPAPPLEEFLQSLKPMFVADDEEIMYEQDWQDAVKRAIGNAPDLEKLVEVYAGKGRMTSRQQIANLRGIVDTLPSTVHPEVTAFTQRALLSLQSNPGWRYDQKERMLKSLVSSFASQ